MTRPNATRQQHIAWVKQRALEYLPNDVEQAFASYISDMRKHPEADPGCVIHELAFSLKRSGRLKTAQQMREFIEGTIS